MKIPERLLLSDSQVEVHFDISPLPKPKKDGTYSFSASRSRKTRILLRFHQEGEWRSGPWPWNFVIEHQDGHFAGKDGGVNLTEDDRYQLDCEGWGILRRYGLMPTRFIP